MASDLTHAAGAQAIEIERCSVLALDLVLPCASPLSTEYHLIDLEFCARSERRKS